RINLVHGLWVLHGWQVFCEQKERNMKGRVIPTDQLPFYDSSQRRLAIIEDAVELYRYRDLLYSLVQRDLTVRYKRSVLGFLWTMLNPLLTMIVMTIVFSTLFRFQIEHYPVYLLSGLLIWNFFSQSTFQAVDSLVWGGGLISKIYLPKSVFVVSAVLVGLVNLLLALIPLFLIMFATGQPLTWALLFLPVPLVLTCFLTLGVGLFVAAIAVFFSDVAEIYRVGLTIVMYLTPIFYPASIVPERFAVFLRLNPIYYFIELFRVPIYQGQLPDLSILICASLIAVGSLLVGWWFFTRKADEFAYRV
ncbi:MAG: ABC transporter permease, partial [Chloroflexota bacterium]|nr:ABC transporter permease [Chloroflexota bacterium]